MEWVKLGDVVDIKTGKLNANAAVENGKYPFFTTAEEVSRIDTYSYDDEVVLVAGNGELNVKYYKGKFDAYQRTYILTLKENQNYILRFIYYFLSSYIKILRYQAIGGVIKYIKLENLTEAKLPVLTIKEQEKLIDIFENLEKLIQTRQDQIQALDDLVESTFYDSFGIYISNKDNTVGLKDITSHISSGSTPRGGSNVYLSEGIPIIRSQDVLMNKLDLTNVAYISEETHNSMRRSKLKNKDILLNITGASIGRTAVFNGEDDSANTNQHVASIRLSTKEFLPEFISYYFSTDYFQSLIKNICSGGTREALNYTQIGMFKIPNVDIEKQNLFAAFVEKIEGQKEILNRSLEELRDLFDSLMQDAFDGSMVK